MRIETHPNRFGKSIISELTYPRPDRLASAELPEMVNQAFWAWYVGHKTKEIFTIKWWFIRHTFTVQQLKALFEVIFGPAPSFA